MISSLGLDDAGNADLIDPGSANRLDDKTGVSPPDLVVSGSQMLLTVKACFLCLEMGVLLLELEFWLLEMGVWFLEMVVWALELRVWFLEMGVWFLEVEFWFLEMGV